MQAFFLFCRRDTGAAVAKGAGRLLFCAWEPGVSRSWVAEAASLHVVQGAEGLQALDPGGLETLDADLPAFAARLTFENHTLRRALTDPHQFSGIGNAYCDEMLHAARLSPTALAQRLSGEEIARLYEMKLRARRCGNGRRDRGERPEAASPEKVTAFREGTAVHGRYGKPCLRCRATVQRVRYADNETNYCARCQTSGKLLADRAPLRLLKQDWPPNARRA